MHEGTEAEIDAVLGLVEAIYDTVLEPKLWPQVLERISAHIGQGCAGISLIDTRSNAIRVAAHWGAPPDFMQAMMQAVPINPANTAHWFTPVDEPFTVERLVGREAYLQSRFYRTVNAPHGCRDGLISILSRSGDRYGNIALPRWTDHGPITETDRLRLKRLSPHIRRAVTLTDLLDSRALRDSLLSQTFDLLRTPVLLVTDDGAIAHANRAADAVLDAGRLLRRNGGHLAAVDPAAAHALRTALNQTSSGQGLLGASRLSVALDPDGPATAWLLPLDTRLGRDTGGRAEPLIAVFLSDPAGDTPLPAELFVRRYGVTPAEGRVLNLLIEGTPPAEAADILGLSINTVRSHMQQLFAKTDCAGLPELMSFAGRHLAPVI